MINTFVIKACSIILDFIYCRYLRDYTYEMIIFQIVSSLNLCCSDLWLLHSIVDILFYYFVDRKYESRQVKNIFKIVTKTHRKTFQNETL